MRSALLLGFIGAALASPLISDSLLLAPLVTPPAPPARLAIPLGEDAPYTHGLRPDSPDSHVVPDSYIVVFKSGLAPKLHDLHHALVDKLHAADVALRHQQILATSTAAPAVADLGGRRHVYSIGSTMRGYAGRFSADLVDAIRAQPEVAFVERDTVVWASDVEQGAPWGLARLSHRKPLSFGTFSKYEYEHAAGLGVTCYVIDTGAGVGHDDLKGRARWGKTVPQNDQDIDANGHGSHVSGTIAGTTFGVAKNATIVAVKVLGSNGSGTMQDVIAGVDWAATQTKKEMEAAAKDPKSKYKGSVANMSLGGGKSPGLDLAVNNAVEDGLHFAVAAGNDAQDACNYSPAAATKAITVGASTIADDRAYFSNVGKCVDVFGPGLNIRSIWNTGPQSTNTISGTSMASPHIAGLAAYLLSLYPDVFVPTVEDWAEEDLLDAAVDEFTNVWRSSRQFVFGKVGQWTGVDFLKSKGGKGKKDGDSKRPKIMPPSVLKKAMIRIASSGILHDLPAGTINRLAFNNFTAPKTQL